MRHKSSSISSYRVVALCACSQDRPFCIAISETHSSGREEVLIALGRRKFPESDFYVTNYPPFPQTSEQRGNLFTARPRLHRRLPDSAHHRTKASLSALTWLDPSEAIKAAKSRRLAFSGRRFP